MQRRDTLYSCFVDKKKIGGILKKLTVILFSAMLALSFSLILVDFGDKSTNTDEDIVVTSLMSVVVTAAPTVDGAVDDEAWSSNILFS